MAQQDQSVLRVGIVPAMIGQEGTDPIVVEIPRNTPPDQIRELALAQARASVPATRRLGMTGGGNQFAGVELPSDAFGDTLAQVLRASPEMAGLLTQIIPQLRGLKGIGAVATDMAIPAATELGRQFLSGEPLSGTEAATHGALGVGAGVIGSGLKAAASGGHNLIRKSLNLKGGPFAYDEVAESEIPRRLLKERAEMTIPGVAKLEEKVDATGDPWLAQATQALKKARYDTDNAPVGGSGGILAALRDFLDPRRQMALGQKLAEPFGVKGEYFAEGAEGLTRLLTALAASLRPERSGSLSGEPMDPNRPGAGPRRRSQQ